jgi:small subunit ribosomal protein S18
MARPKSRDRERKGKRWYRPRKKKVCHFCTNPNDPLDYKNVDTLRKFVSDRGKILPKRRTGTCPKHQRELARQIKKAREAALLPYTVN